MTSQQYSASTAIAMVSYMAGRFFCRTRDVVRPLRCLAVGQLGSPDVVGYASADGELIEERLTCRLTASPTALWPLHVGHRSAASVDGTALPSRSFTQP